MERQKLVDKQAESDRQAGIEGLPGTGGLQIGRVLPLGATAGAAFEQERTGLLLRRVRLVFWIGLGVNLLLWAFTAVVPLAEPVTRTVGSWWWKDWSDAAYPLSVALGLLVVYFAHPGTRALEATAFTVAVLNMLLGVAVTSFARPDMLLGFWVSLILFVMAALLPWDVRWQAALALLTVTASVGFLVLARDLDPAVRAFWSGELAVLPARDFLDQVLLTAAGTTVLGVTSVVVATTLYNLRRTAFRAKRLGNYLIHRQLDEGGMGQVYVAEHALMCRPSAVKVLRPDKDDDGSALARFEREVRLASSLTHPNTITIFDFGRASDDTFYYAMEYLHGMDLQRFVERFGPTPANRTVYIMLQVAASLREAHERGIMHRDLKPSNIFLTMRGGMYDFVKVLDFGLAKQIEVVDGEVELTQSGVIFGTPRYLAPESVYGDAGVDERADIYNFGGVTFWLLTGRPPFTADKPVQLMIDQVKTPPPVPSEVCEMEIPPELDAIVLRCLEKDPDDRFRTVQELQAALEAVPLDPPWDGDQAETWWNLHMSHDEALEDSFLPPVTETTRGEIDRSELEVVRADS